MDLCPPLTSYKGDVLSMCVREKEGVGVGVGGWGGTVVFYRDDSFQFVSFFRLVTPRFK